MPWLLRDGEVLASVHVADTTWRRARGLIGQPELEGALLLRPAFAVHTLGVRFDLDVAFCSADLEVLETIVMSRWRVGAPRRRARAVVEANAGAFERWQLRPGDRLEVA